MIKFKAGDRVILKEYMKGIPRGTEGTVMNYGCAPRIRWDNSYTRSVAQSSLELVQDRPWEFGTILYIKNTKEKCVYISASKYPEDCKVILEGHKGSSILSRRYLTTEKPKIELEIESVLTNNRLVIREYSCYLKIKSCFRGGEDGYTVTLKKSNVRDMIKTLQEFLNE